MVSAAVAVCAGVLPIKSLAIFANLSTVSAVRTIEQQIGRLSRLRNMAKGQAEKTESLAVFTLFGEMRTADGGYLEALSQPISSGRRVQTRSIGMAASGVV